MPEISIKKNKKETFLDLSGLDLQEESFFRDFAKFTKERSAFLSGTSVSLILPVPRESTSEDLSVKNNNGKELETLVDKIQKELNKKNISLRASYSGDQAKVLVEEKTSEEDDDDDKLQLPDTLYIKANLRSGQLIKYPGNVFVFGDVNPSAEIVAGGDIIVWGTLRGVVHAGAGGTDSSLIAALKIDCGQLRISDKFIAIQKNKSKGRINSKTCVPEIAKLVDNKIKIFETY